MQINCVCGQNNIRTSGEAEEEIENNGLELFFKRAKSIVSINLVFAIMDLSMQSKWQAKFKRL